MTATDTDKAQLVAALLADPDFLDSLRTATRARAERPFFNMAGERIDALAATPVGRVQVSPGQTISSASWGNPVWDQSINCFASTTDRDSQWPTPHEGSECYTVDTGSPWVYRSGAWHGRPKGYLAGVLGPATGVSAGASPTTVVTLNVPVVAGRWYRASGFMVGTQQTSTAAAVRLVMSPSGGLSNNYIASSNSLPAGQSIMGVLSFVMQAAATTTQAFVLTANTNVGTLLFNPNTASIYVEDVGG